MDPQKMLLYKVCTHLDAFFVGVEFTALFLTAASQSANCTGLHSRLKHRVATFTELLTGALWGSITLSSNDVISGTIHSHHVR